MELIKWAEGKFLGVDSESNQIHLIYDPISTDLFIKSTFNIGDIEEIEVNYGRQFWLLNLILTFNGSYSIIAGSPYLIFRMRNGKKHKFKLRGIENKDFKKFKSEVEKLNHQLK